MPKISRALPRGGPTPIAKVSEKNDPKPLSQVKKETERRIAVIDNEA